MKKKFCCIREKKLGAFPRRIGTATKRAEGVAPGEEGGPGSAGGGPGHLRLLAPAAAAAPEPGPEQRGGREHGGVHPRPGGHRPGVHGEAAEAEGAAEGVAGPAAEREGGREGATEAGK